jgi:hypothetical protein
MRKVTKAEKRAQASGAAKVAAKKVATKRAKDDDEEPKGHGGGDTRSAGPKGGVGKAEPKGGKVGRVLKSVFPEYDADQLKILRRYLRTHWRSEDGLQHNWCGKWVFTPKEEKIAREIAKEVQALNK